MWKTIPILICLSLIAVAAIDENKERPTLIELDPDLSSTNGHQDYPDSPNLTSFSQMPFDIKIRVFDCMDAVSFIRSSVVCHEWLSVAKQSTVFHTVKEILLGENCPKSSDLLNVLRLLEARPGRYPILTEIFSKTESKRIVTLYDRIESLPIPQSYCDTLCDKLVAAINDDVIRQLFAGLRRHSQWSQSVNLMPSWARRNARLVENFAKTSQDLLRKLLPKGLLEPLYYEADHHTYLESLVEDRFVKKGVAHLLLSEKVLELLAFCGIRIKFWNLFDRVPDISAEQLEAILPFFSDFLYVNRIERAQIRDYLGFNLWLAHWGCRRAPFFIYHLPAVVNHYRAHLDDLANLKLPSLQLMIELQVPFLQDLLYHRFGLIRDTLLHVLCKHNQIDTIVLLASQYEEYVSEALITTNDNGLVPFYYLRWESISILQQNGPEVASLMFSSAPNAFVIRRLNIGLSEWEEWMNNTWHDLLLSELSDTDQNSATKLFRISSRCVQQSLHLRDDLLRDDSLEEDLYDNDDDSDEDLSDGENSEDDICDQVLNLIRSETDPDIRSALLTQLAADDFFKTIIEKTSTNDSELEQVLVEAKNRRQVFDDATEDTLQMLLVTESASSLNRPDPITHRHSTALHMAFYHCDYDLVTKALSVDGVDSSVRDGNGMVPFQYASDWLIWRLVRDLPNTMMESLIRSHPLTFLYASDRVLSKADDYRSLHLLFENLHLFHICVSQLTASTSSTLSADAP